MLKNFDEVIEKVRSIEPFTVSVAAAAGPGRIAKR